MILPTRITIGQFYKMIDDYLTATNIFSCEHEKLLYILELTVEGLEIRFETGNVSLNKAAKRKNPNLPQEYCLSEFNYRYLYDRYDEYNTTISYVLLLEFKTRSKERKFEPFKPILRDFYILRDDFIRFKNEHPEFFTEQIKNHDVDGNQLTQAYLNPDHPYYSSPLAMAVAAWIAIYINDYEAQEGSIIVRVYKFLSATYPETFGETVIWKGAIKPPQKASKLAERIAKIVNYDKNPQNPK
jgi:hypothetical protein